MNQRPLRDAGRNGDRRPRILWVTTSAGLDGPGRILGALLHHWPAADQIMVCAIGTVSPEFRRDIPPGVELRELGARGSWDARAVSRLADLCRTFQPDIVHTHLSRADWIGRPLARLLNVPVVSTIHNVHSRMYRADYSWLLARVGETLDRLTAPCVHRFIAVSDGVRADLEQSGVPAGRIAVVHNALDLNRRRMLTAGAGVRSAWGCATGDLVIGTVALLKPQKGIPFLIRAARLVLDREPRARFVHMGGGPLAREIADQAARAGLTGRFLLLSHVTNPMALLADLDVFVLASLWEGLPVALLEAMALGLPCVGTRVSGIEEVIEDGISGRLVPPGDPAAMADAILELTANPAQRRVFGAAARERVERRFDATTMARSYRNIYAELTSRVPPVSTRSDVA